MHKVWILDCKSCRSFLTNRGMKAVLLLRPNVPLYSTDALPANCSAYSAHSPSESRPLPKPSSSALDTPRTCECLTQTLCCHGCGIPVGYMIVVPCTRCTSSVLPPPYLAPNIVPSWAFQPPGRATNGHRFVFHSSEILAEERLYVSGEPGVALDADLSVPTPAQPVPSAFPFNSTARSPSAHEQQPHPQLNLTIPPFASPRTSPEHDRDRPYYLPTPPPDPQPHPTFPAAGDGQVSRPPHTDVQIDRLVAGSHALFAHARETIERARRLLAAAPATGASELLSGPASLLTPSTTSPLPPTSPAASNPVGKPSLRSGDVLYWHHLVRCGELPGVRDDERARGSRRVKAGGDMTIGLNLVPEPEASTRPGPRVLCAR